MRLNCALQSAVTDAVSTASRMYLCPTLSRFSDLVVHKGTGAYVWTAEGRKVLDMSSGIGATSTGHCHPRVVEAIQRQASDFIHAQQNCFASNPATRELLQRLEGVIPGHLDTAFFCNSGAEAVENAVKLARAATGKPNIIALEGGFHGRTMGAMALTSSKTVYRQGFAPLMPGTFFSPYPHCLYCRARQLSPHGSSMYRLPPYQPPFNAQGPPQQCCGSPLEALRWMLKQQTAPSETAAVILEPILGEGGFLVPPPGYLQGVQQICRDNGMLLIVDEVQSGVGRTGKWWAYEHFPGLQPDILIFAKGIASGFPFAGLAAAGSLWQALPGGTVGGTYGGNPIACAAASATLDAIREERMLDNAAARGQQLMEGLVQLSREFPIIDVRGRGLMIGFELSPDAGPASASKLCQAALQQDMLLLTAGAREIVRLLPPLNLRPEEADEALKKLRLAFSHVFPSPSAP